VTTDFFQRHRETLERACKANAGRHAFSAYPEVPSGRVYGENARIDGQKAFEARRGTTCRLGQPGVVDSVSTERSPYGLDLGTAYEKSDVDQLVAGSVAAGPDWAEASPAVRVGVLLEMLHRLNARSFEMAFAVMHTTGQGFMMAFQAGGPHAQDRALEAVAWAWDEMSRCPATAMWEKQVGKEEKVTLEKRYRIVPRGVAAVIGCSTFPTWNGYPGMFASLATGNTVIVKPHPGAILPLAISVEIARDVLREAGFSPDVVTMLVDTHDAPITKKLVTHPDVRIIDYTGGSEFGDWIEANASHARVYTEKAGVNAIVIDSVEQIKPVAANIAFTLCLYSGQMCTSSQNIFVSQDGIDTAAGRLSFDEAAGAIVTAIDRLLGDPTRAAEILGAIQNEQTAARIDAARQEAVEHGWRILRDSAPIEHPEHSGARIRTPLVIAVDAADTTAYAREMFGPIVYVVATADTRESIAQAATISRQCGAITASVYATDATVLAQAEDALTSAGAAVSCNLTGSIWVNQSAAFSDFHVSGINPSGNATLCDAAFIAGRYRIAQSRILVPQSVPAGA